MAGGADGSRGGLGTLGGHKRAIRASKCPHRHPPSGRHMLGSLLWMGTGGVRGCGRGMENWGGVCVWGGGVGRRGRDWGGGGGGGA